MTLRKITVDNSVKFIPKSEQTQERVIKPKNTSNCRKENNCHKTLKISLKTYQEEVLK